MEAYKRGSHTDEMWIDYIKNQTAPAVFFTSPHLHIRTPMPIFFVGRRPGGTMTVARKRPGITHEPLAPHLKEMVEWFETGRQITVGGIAGDRSQEESDRSLSGVSSRPLANGCQSVRVRIQFNEVGP
jgi:hypothetical protein